MSRGGRLALSAVATNSYKYEDETRMNVGAFGRLG